MSQCRRVAALAVLLLGATTPAAEWPHWRGLQRNDISAEASGFDGRTWPLQEAFHAKVGNGSSSPVIADGKLFTLGHDDNSNDLVQCLDAATGKLLWTQKYAAPPYGRKANGDQGIYRGPSSTPAFDGKTGFLYTLGLDGDLICWNTKNEGRRVWARNLYDDFDPPQRPKVGRSGQRDYGFTTAPLVHGDWLIVEVGGKAGNLIAFDKRNGKQLWASENQDPAGHTGGVVPIIVDGLPCLAVLTHFHLLVVRLDRGREGQTVAEYPWITEFANSIATPAVHENFVVITAGYNHQKMCKLEITREGARKVWERDFTSKVCSPVIHDDHIYWAWRDVYCVDFETGKLRWKGPSGLDTPGSCIVTADQRLIVLAENGTLLLMETAHRSPDKSTVLFRRDRLFRTDAWPHVALANGRVYCKDRDGNLICFAASAEALAQILYKPPVAASSTSRPPSSSTPKTPRLQEIDEVAVELKSWPGRQGTVVAWKADFDGKQVVGFTADGLVRWPLTQAGKATYDSIQGLTLDGGTVRVERANAPLLAAVKDSNELTIEVVLTSDNGQQEGPARIISFSTDAYHRNFTLGQSRGSYNLRLRTPQTGENGSRPEVTLCPVNPSRSQHLIVSYREGLLVCYVDGKLNMQTDRIRGDFRNWTSQHFLLGDEHNGGRDWSGRIERFAVLSRFVGPKEAARRRELVAADQPK